MRILISNDDGILAPGLAALYQAVADMGEVTVMAPDSPQSAAGHSITLSHPLAVRRVHVRADTRRGVGAGHVGAGADFHGISVDGRPADCVRLAIRNLLPQPPELVLAGVNAGANVGINVFYSGTVAAAAEGAMMGIPSVAFSAAMTSGEVDFARAAKLCRWVLDRLLASGLGSGELINVNIPELAGKRGQAPISNQSGAEIRMDDEIGASPHFPRGVRVVPQSTAGIDDEYVRDANLGGECYRLGEKYGFFHHEGESDVVALAEGYITVTPLHVDMTRHERLAKLKALAWDAVPNDE